MKSVGKTIAVLAAFFWATDAIEIWTAEGWTMPTTFKIAITAGLVVAVISSLETAFPRLRRNP